MDPNKFKQGGVAAAKNDAKADKAEDDIDSDYEWDEDYYDESGEFKDSKSKSIGKNLSQSNQAKDLILQQLKEKEKGPGQSQATGASKSSLFAHSLQERTDAVQKAKDEMSAAGNKLIGEQAKKLNI